MSAQHPNTRKLPLWAAVLINANIVIGSAFFIGAPSISAKTGILAPFMWILCGLMLFPLMLVLARLSKTFPSSGGIYVYSQRTLGHFFGFISGWGYYIGTAAGNAAVLHIFSKKLQKFDCVQSTLGSVGLGGLRFDILLVILFAFLNLFNIDFLERIQIGFTIVKVIPFLLIIVAVPLLFTAPEISFKSLDVTGFFEVIPLVLFAYIGIEACCAITDKIEDGHKNASKAIMISFALIMSIYTITQLLLSCIHTQNPKDPFLGIMPMLSSDPTIVAVGNYIIYVSLLSSFLAGYYGMFYYNNWNLHAIATENGILGSKWIQKLNKHQTPWVAVIIQSLLVMAFLFITTKKRYLITMGDVGTTMAYLLSSIAYLSLYRNLTGFLSLISCGILIYIYTSSLAHSGFQYLIPFIAILVVGLLGYKLNQRLKQ
jgi:amino acid transporter